MGAAFNRIDVVRVAEDRFVEAVIVLHRHFGLDVVLLTLEVDDVGQRLLAAVEVLHELDDAALVVEFLRTDTVFEALVVEQDADAFIEEGELPQAIGKDIPLVLGDLEDLAIGLEGDVGASVAGRLRSGQW